LLARHVSGPGVRHQAFFPRAPNPIPTPTLREDSIPFHPFHTRGNQKQTRWHGDGGRAPRAAARPERRRRAQSSRYRSVPHVVDGTRVPDSETSSGTARVLWPTHRSPSPSFHPRTVPAPTTLHEREKEQKKKEIRQISPPSFARLKSKAPSAPTSRLPRAARRLPPLLSPLNWRLELDLSAAKNPTSSAGSSGRRPPLLSDRWRWRDARVVADDQTEVQVQGQARRGGRLRWFLPTQLGRPRVRLPVPVADAAVEGEGPQPRQPGCRAARPGGAWAGRVQAPGARQRAGAGVAARGVSVRGRRGGSRGWVLVCIGVERVLARVLG
jgi:hypothetical protein